MVNSAIFKIKMELLNLPDYSHRLRLSPSKDKIFDSIRKKYVALTPEEWVRQNFIAFLTQELHYPPGLLALEYPLSLNGLSKRCDLVVFNSMGESRMILEFKASSVKIDQKVFDQIALYNLKLKVDYLIVSNGLSHFCCRMDYLKNSYQFLEEIPVFEVIKQ